MSFKFNWNFIDYDQLQQKAREVLGETMNKGPQPEMIVEQIKVQDFDLGSEAPKLEILEIGDIDQDRFRGIFKLEYQGDAKLSLITKVEANALAQSFENYQFVSPKFGAASTSLILPLNINLSEIRLSAIIILVFSKARGLTLVFRNDPLQSVNVTSTFDFLPGVSAFLKQEIEARLRESFREDIPEVLYQLSQQLSQDDQKPFFFHSAHNQITHDLPPPVSFNDIEPTHEYCHHNNHNQFELASLAQCQHTLALFTPGLRDTISRATLERYEIKHGLKGDSEKEEEKEKQQKQSPRRFSGLDGNSVNNDQILRSQLTRHATSNSSSRKRRVINMSNNNSFKKSKSSKDDDDETLSPPAPNLAPPQYTAS